MTRSSIVLSFVLAMCFVATSASTFAQLPIYSADPVRRARQLAITSQNLRAMEDDWERFWFLDQPSALTPYRVSGIGSMGRSSPGTFGGVVSRTPAFTPLAPTPFTPSGPIIVRAPVATGPRVEKAAERHKAPFEREDGGALTEDERMAELFAKGEKAEAAGKNSVAKLYYGIVARNASGPLQLAAEAKLQQLAASG